MSTDRAFPSRNSSSPPAGRRGWPRSGRVRWGGRRPPERAAPASNRLTPTSPRPSPPPGAERGTFRILAPLLLGLALAACAPTFVEGDADGVIVENRSSLGIGFVGAELGSFSERARELALERADRHCARFGKRARLVARNHDVYQYACFADGAAGKAETKG